MATRFYTSFLLVLIHLSLALAVLACFLGYRALTMSATNRATINVLKETAEARLDNAEWEIRRLNRRMAAIEDRATAMQQTLTDQTTLILRSQMGGKTGSVSGESETEPPPAAAQTHTQDP